MTVTVEVCPDCDSASIETRQGNSLRRPVVEYDYRCTDCPATFSDPVTRPRQQSASLSGDAKRLDEADPEEVFG